MDVNCCSERRITTARHLTAPEARPGIWVQLIALFLWELWSRSPPSSARTPVPGHPAWLMEAWPRRILHPLWDGVAGAGPGGEWVGGELQPVPNPTGFCVYAGHQSSADEVRGCLNYVSVVLIKNLWGSCNWLKWGFRAVHGLHLTMPSVCHHDLG